jgi:hypothetical protein
MRDLKTRGCPVCDSMEDALLSCLARWQHDLVEDETTRKMFAEEGGFCRTHLWQLAAFSSPQGLAKGFPPLLSRLTKTLLQAADGIDANNGAPSPPLPRAENCRVCSLLRAEERIYVAELASFLDSEEGRAVYERSQGLCLRHLRILIQSDPSGDSAAFLLRKAACRLQEIETSLRSYRLKFESLRRHECTPEEKDADRRALIQIAGARNLSFPFR